MQGLMLSYLVLHVDCFPGDNSYQQAQYFSEPFTAVYVDGLWPPSCWSNCLWIAKNQIVGGSTMSGVVYVLDAIPQSHCQRFAVADHIHSVPVLILQVAVHP